MKLKQIVIASDFSEESSRPFRPVADLAKRTGARVTLVHAVQTLTGPSDGGRPGTPLGPPDYQPEVSSAETALGKLAESFSVPASARVVTGSSSSQSIIKCATDLNADLIALSTHGRTGFRRAVMGSFAEEVLRRSPIPVLCVPKREASDESSTELKHILLTTDLSAEALRPLDPIVEFAKELNCRITVLHVVQLLRAIPYGAPLAPGITSADAGADIESARQLAEEQCAPIAEQVDVSVRVISHEDPAQAVVEFARRNDVDLVALSTHGRSGFKRAVLGSVAEQVLRRSDVPVLSFHRSEV